MTAEGWKDAILMAVRNHDDGDADLLNLMSRLLEEQDIAKATLNTLGFGCVGMPWLKVVNEIRCRQQP